MSDPSDGPIRARKRGKRKRLQKDYQESKREQMQLQLERRFGKQSTSSGDVEDIPLPDDSSSDDPPRLTAADMEKDYLSDPRVVATHSGQISRSERIVRKAEEAERYMLNRCGSSVQSILSDFRTKILEACREKRRLQDDVPRVKHPYHQTGHTKHWTGVMPNDEEIHLDKSASEDDGMSSESENNDLDDSIDDEEKKNRQIYQEKKRVVKKRKFAERVRQQDLIQQEIDRKRNHPNKLHEDIQFNEKGLGNDGPECRCRPEFQAQGLRHGYYAGENKPIDCSGEDGPNLYCYTLRVTPAPNNDQVHVTNMKMNGEEFEFEGFSMITHQPLPDFMTRSPICKSPLDYSFELVQEPIPSGCFWAEDTVPLFEYMFHEVGELLDFNLRPKHLPEGTATCPVIHIMPRFVLYRDGIVNLWSTKTVLAYFVCKASNPMFSQREIEELCNMDDESFERETRKFKQAIILNPCRKPAAIRADWFERDKNRKTISFVHNAVRQSLLSSTASRITYLERKLAKIRNKPSSESPDVNQKWQKELEFLKNEAKKNRNFRHTESMFGYTSSGLKPDVVAHMAMTVLASHHIRYQFGLSEFERGIGYQFSDRRVLELAMTHPSFKSNYGTPSDHVKNLIANCGYRKKYTSDEKGHRRRNGAVNLFTIVTGDAETEPILHNERLEYLGDAVVELIVSHHLFFMFPHHLEGGLATYRTSLVQNRNLADLAQNIRINELVQYAHGAELCHEGDFKHALANAFEALMAAVYLDSGLANCDRIYSQAMFGADPELRKIWDHINEHELKREDPLGDRELSKITPALSKFHALEQSLGVQFNNIRLLAKAFTRRNVPHNDLTKGHNQRLEWLGDSVLQLIVSDYLFHHFPLHHEGHMSLLRTSLVSNQTQAVVCDDLGFGEYVIVPPGKQYVLKMKDKADLVEAFIGALYVDQGLEPARVFVRIVFCPRLKYFIASDTWNDAKSHLQQWCLTMRDDNLTPEMPEYRTLGIEGPTNNRVYRVAVYLRKERLATATASTVHAAELRTAERALSYLRFSEKGMGDGAYFRKVSPVDSDEPSTSGT